MTDKSKPKKDPNQKYFDNDKYSFFLKQLAETGLTFEANEFKYQREGRGATAWYMIPDADGNVRFYVPDIITGDLEQYTYGGDGPKIKIRDWYLTRWKVPKETNTGPAKYTPVKGSGTRCLFTKPVVDCYKEKKQIQTLFVVEGFKKALSAAHIGGLPVIGMNGLFGFKDPDKKNQSILRKEIKEVLITCQVQNVVVIFDSDLFDMYSGNKKSKSGKREPETKRLNQFLAASISAKTLFQPFADVYLSHPNPAPEKKYGLDDLLGEHRTVDLDKLKDTNSWNKAFAKAKPKQLSILEDLIVSVKKNDKSKYFTSYKISAIHDFKVRSIFHLANAQQFYEHYKEQLQQIPAKRFRYYTHIYEIQPDETIQEVQDAKTSTLGFKEVGNILYRENTDKGTKKEVANFVMRVLFQINSSEDPKRICEIKNYDNVTRVVEVTGKSFGSLAEFRILMINEGDFIWSGSGDDLLALMKLLFRHEKPATQINILGWQSEYNFYAFSNGIVVPTGFLPVDEYGMVTYGDVSYYLPAWSKFNAKQNEDYREIKRFSHHTHSKQVDFGTWKKQFVKVYGNNGEIAICCFIAGLFSDIVYDHKSGIGFPMPWSAGKPQSGKSTICESILNMFGQKSEPIGLDGVSTPKYIAARFGQVCNGAVHLEEYSNTKVPPKIREWMKKIYDRIGYGTKAYSNDTRTKQIPILSPGWVSGEEIPTDNYALFTRAILMMWNKTKFTPEETDNMRRLKNMEEQGLTNITVNLLMCRQLIATHFDETYREVFAELSLKFRKKKIDNRMLNNAAWMIAPFKILLEHNKIESETSINQLIAIFVDNIEKQAAYLKENTDVAKFWDIVEILYREREIKEGKDFKFQEDCIALQLRPIHHYYNITARKLGYEKILDRSTLENYLTNEPYYREMKTAGGRKTQVRFEGNPVPAMFFVYSDIGINLQSPVKNKTEEAMEEEREEVPEAPVPEMGELFEIEPEPVKS